MNYEKQAIEWLKLGSEMSLAYYEKPLLLCYSGGKDSDVILELVKRSGVPFEVQHSHTTADAPQTVYHVRKVFRDLELKGYKATITYPTYKGKRVTLWELIPQMLMPPTRIMRYCCSVCKETAGKSRQIVTGVRKDESSQRSTRGAIETVGKTKKQSFVYNGEDNQQTLFLNNDNDPKRKIIEHCERQGKTICNPIIDWDKYILWDYINSENIETNVLYKNGFKRVGCIGCPMAGERRKFEFNMFPAYKKMYIRSFDKLVDVLKRKGNVSWKSGVDCFEWWMEEKNLDGQFSFEQLTLGG